ncbi:MAG: amino acid adenylation domain-containing protein [Gammaproteobacteria bacterium]
MTAALDCPDTPVAQLALMPADICQRVLRDINATQAALPEWRTLHDGFLARASCEPTACALRSAHRIEGDDWSCGLLATRSARLAHELLARGAGSGSRVGVAIGRSPELVLAVLGVLRAGGVVVPLDPGFPAARLEFIAQDADLALLVTCGERFSIEGTETFDLSKWLQLSTAASTTDPSTGLPEVQDDSAAFMLYTSGSTGEPKGAWTTHQAAVNRCHWMWHHFGFGSDDVFALRTTPNFIDAWWEIFGALVYGAPLQIVPDEIAVDPLHLPAFVADRSISQLVLVPSLLETLLDQIEVDGISLPALRFCISSGEPLSPALVSRCRQWLPSTTVINTYGTSEIWDATAFDVRDLDANAERVPIGKPVANARIYVLDRSGEPLPPGIPGELCVAGFGVNGGYWQRPHLDARRYIQAELPGIAGQRLYRTGDRGRCLADGNFECLGRLDAQFKLRGQRIEPAEIEQVLQEHPAVAAAIVGVAGSSDDARLVAGIVLRNDAGPDVNRSGAALKASLRQHLQGRLPAWMMPAEWHRLVEVPRTPSGKLDRSGWRAGYGAAPLMTATDGGDTPARSAPSDGIERQLLGLWSAVMGRSDIDIHDNFFDIGGHSLLASRLLNRIRATFNVPLQLRDLFARPTVAGVAALLRDERARVVESQVAGTDAAGDDAEAALSFGQERLWFLDQLDPASPAWNVAWTIHVTGFRMRTC